MHDLHKSNDPAPDATIQRTFTVVNQMGHLKESPGTYPYHTSYPNLRPPIFQQLLQLANLVQDAHFKPTGHYFAKLLYVSQCISEQTDRADNSDCVLEQAYISG